MSFDRMIRAGLADDGDLVQAGARIFPRRIEIVNNGNLDVDVRRTDIEGVSVSRVYVQSDVPGDQADWLVLKPVEDAYGWSAVDEDGFGRYYLRANSNILPMGFYNGRFVAELSNGEQVSVPFSLRDLTPLAVGSIDKSGALGTLLFYRRLPNGEFTVEYEGLFSGVSNLTFNLPVGHYRVFLSTDLDGDGAVCGAYEICAAYPADGSTVEFSADPLDRQNRLVDLLMQWTEQDISTP
jgi:hypothetical protein